MTGISIKPEENKIGGIRKKSLLLKWATFRDKLQPGGKEEWKLQIMHPDKKAADAQLLATLYDASLDKLYINDWNFNLSLSRFIPDTGANLIYLPGIPSGP